MRGAMHVHHHAWGIQQRTWAGQLELCCARRDVGVQQWHKRWPCQCVHNGVLAKAERACPTPRESLAANLLLRTDERKVIAHDSLSKLQRAHPSSSSLFTCLQRLIPMLKRGQAPARDFLLYHEQMVSHTRFSGVFCIDPLNRMETRLRDFRILARESVFI